MAMFAFAAALAGFITAVPVLEPLSPASRGFVRELVNDAILSKSNEEKMIYNRLQSIDSNILGGKLTGLTGQLQVLNSQLALIIAKLKDTPNDGFLLSVKAQTESDIDTITKEITVTKCQKQLSDSPNSAC